MRRRQVTVERDRVMMRVDLRYVGHDSVQVIQTMCMHLSIPDAVHAWGEHPHMVFWCDTEQDRAG